MELTFKLQFELPSIFRHLMPDSSYFEKYILGICFNYDESGIITIDNTNSSSDYQNN